jgi:hypothetical protein
MEAKLDNILNFINEIKATPSKLINASYDQNNILKSFGNKFEKTLKYFIADDAKIFKKINSIDDSINLQGDLTNNNNWCNLNGLYFNISKYKVLTFNIKKFSINYDYKLNNVSIESVN